MPDPTFDPEKASGMKWFIIIIPLDWIVKIWKKIFNKKEE